MFILAVGRLVHRGQEHLGPIDPSSKDDTTAHVSDLGMGSRVSAQSPTQDATPLDPSSHSKKSSRNLKDIRPRTRPQPQVDIPPPETPWTPARSATSSPNPFIHGIPPREDESSHERALREQEEVRAKAISDAIDEQIKQDKVAFGRYQRAIKLLLLGQSESGQSNNTQCCDHY